MVFMVRLTLGIFLSSLLCIINAVELSKSLTNRDDQQYFEPDNHGSHLNANLTLSNLREITDEDVENIVKPFEFKKINDKNETIKLSHSEPYTTQKTLENSRTGSGRSVDIDIEKYNSPDFNNSVFTLQTSPLKKYESSEELNSKSTENIHQFEYIELTTPKTPYFDKKFKETVESVNQKLEVDSSEFIFDNDTQTANYSADNLIEEADKNPNGTKFEYKNYKNVEFNETKTPHSKHKDIVQENQTILNFENKRNVTETYHQKKTDDDGNELHKNGVKYFLGNENVNEVKKEEDSNLPSTLRTNLHLTTKKHGITKHPTDKTDTGIISNKIEGENLKFLPITSPTSILELSTNRTIRRGSIKYADYQKLSSTTQRSEKRKLEQVVQENQIVPVQVTPPTTTSNTERSSQNEETTTTFENVSFKNNAIDPEEQGSTTVLIILQPEDTKPTTVEEFTTKDDITIASTPKGFSIAETSSTLESNQEITTKFEETTTTVETTTPIETTTKLMTTTSKTTDEIETTETIIQTTILENLTTFNELEVSKEVKFPTTTEINPINDKTTFVPIIKSSEETTTTELPVESTTRENVDTTPMTTHIVETTKIIGSTQTKTLLENKTNEAKTTQEEPKTTSIDFVHIKNIDSNHTTLLPDELSPNVIYSTPVGVSEIRGKITSESSTSEETTNSPEPNGPEGNNGTIVAIIISCVGGICLIVLAFLLIVMRNRQKRFNYGQRCRPVSLDDYSVDNVSVFNSVRRKNAARSSKRSYGNPAFEDPVCLSHPLNFPAISKFAANEEDINTEFSEIPQIIARTSELPEGCETKNRYANVIPLPESRVFLKHIEGYPNSDYINANYVTGPKNIRKYYIACQAPMSNTVDDFWRMIWEQQCKVILMLTHLFENGGEKCFDYLPPSEVLDCHRLFGDFQVTLKKREVKEKYIISSIQLKNMVSNSWREVTHFWYMGWPEKGVPTEANSIIAFLIEARSYMKSATIEKKTDTEGNMNGGSSTEVNPVVVHCSPGTGRTGVVIACDIAIRDFEQTRHVDIPKILYRIRRDRASAVQTKEQYAFIYRVINLYASKLAGRNLESF